MGVVISTHSAHCLIGYLTVLSCCDWLNGFLAIRQQRDTTFIAFTWSWRFILVHWFYWYTQQVVQKISTFVCTSIHGYFWKAHRKVLKMPEEKELFLINPVDT